MQNMKKNDGNDGDSYVKNSGEVPKLKRRHIVSWSSEEDDILREQIEKHGTDNWAIIASKFKDKTTRQCRRRWYTYLNSDFKKGGWSPEEDLLLCEAQKIFGNRWTEIAKVVSGRTDNAVKNRFSTLCKKRAKHEALATENNEFINLNNKRVVFPNGFNIDRAPESGAPLKKMRQPELHISSPSNSDYSSGSTRLSQPDYGRIESSKAGHDALLLQNIEDEVYSTAIGDQRASEPVQENYIAVYENTDMECSSPIQVTPLFRSLAAVVPTPNFSESERRFLLSALGLESTSPKPSGNTPKHPPCKRVLLHSL